MVLRLPGAAAVLAAAALAAAGPAAAAPTPPTAAPLAAQAPGAIAGTVADQATGQPLLSAQISIPALGVGAPSRDGGRFVLPGVPPGDHRLRIELIGYAAVELDVTVAAGETALVQALMNRVALQLQEIVVTGTAFPESPVALPYAVSVAARRTLAEQGSPQAVDFFRNLVASAGVIGERQSWYSTRPAVSVPETVANVNLRGLGASRTLVLLNGRRQTYLPARLFGGRFVDVNVFPGIAIDRIEVLKEGASAVYGSDAVAGVANFITRADFEGFEAEAAHEYYAGGGDTSAGAIWGRRFGGGAGGGAGGGSGNGSGEGGTHVVISAEAVAQQELSPAERPWSLRGYTPGGGSWSFTGNPGAFLMPRLTGGENRAEFVDALRDAQFGGWGGVIVDPRCTAFGGHLEPSTCRFRYAPWDNLVQASRIFRAFAEVHGSIGEATRYHVETLWSEARTPNWLTTPSFPPVSPHDGAQIVQPDHPGRAEFCRAHGPASGFASTAACLEDDWYFYGRLVGNSGPGRALGRASRTQRVAASLERDLNLFGDRPAALEAAASFSRSSGNVNLPAEYAYRKFLAFRGFGGPGCGVSVKADPGAPSGMALANPGSALPGQGACMYYNPFSSAHLHSAQPGSLYFNSPNPDHAPALANPPELIDWINEQVDIDNASSLFVADVLVKGEVLEGLMDYAAGYQFRRVGVSAVPNDPGNLALNPCPVPGDRSCAGKTGAFTFTTGRHPYRDDQTVHRVFVEVPLHLHERAHVHSAVNFETHGGTSSIDPKVSARLQLAEPLSLRASVQTTFRTPSVDDLNEDPQASLEYVSEAGIYKPLDTYGSRLLEPERALTYNLGATLATSRVRATVDYWDYDFRNVIDVFPYAGLTRLYHQGGAAKAAVQRYVTCPDGPGTGSCDVTAVERLRVENVNWPGIEMAGLDWHLSARTASLSGIISFGLDGAWLRRFFVKSLDLNGQEVFAAQDAGGKLNWNNPIAPPLPRWKTRFSLGYHFGDYSAVSYVNAVSSYENEVFPGTEYARIDRFATWDLSALRRASGSLDLALSALNLLDSAPPLVNWEQSFDGSTHSPKGLRVKLSATYRPGARGPLR